MEDPIEVQPLPLRSESPSPSVSPTVASTSCPQSERSLSAASSMTSVSRVSSNDSTGENSGKRRGFCRPQATIFADSARNRDSVMSLGSIAHLQYYFARTGLLDGKGAQLAPETKKGEDGVPLILKSSLSESLRSPSGGSFADSSTYAYSNFDPEESSAQPGSPELSGSLDPSGEPSMLSLLPTISTYKHKAHHVPSPPNMTVLRRELREALEDAKKVLEAQEVSKEQEESAKDELRPSTATNDPAPTQGWHEIEGLHILDLVTLAIRAAKNYYTSHEQPQRLYNIQSERKLRTDLYAVLEVLKKIGARNFAGGYRHAEIKQIIRWITGIEDLVNKDEKAEAKEQESRGSWMWLNGSCNGHEREREWVFLKTFEPPGNPLPPWSEPSDENGEPTAFLLSLQNGIKLIELHNELVKNSWRQFGEIKTWHTDTNKPYRRMENLRYWVKAAQLRWDLTLDVDVSAVVQGKQAAWKTFDAAVLQWCKAVREELTAEWREHHGDPTKAEQPIVQVDPGGASDNF